MDYTIRKMIKSDEEEILKMMEVFYSSDAVSTNGSVEIFKKDFDMCIESSVLEGYVFCKDDEILGYSMLAKSFSTEFGKECIWFEDFYLKPQYRGLHIIPEFIKYIKNLYPNVLFRVEAEKENTHALHVYKKSGFQELPYIELKM